MATATSTMARQNRQSAPHTVRAQARRSVRARTIPEQIADHLAVAIINGEYRNGEHIPEQRIASLFGVSHGPVREAIRALSKRGLVEFRPRRGAFVIEVTLDGVADIFNIRAVLLGLAAQSLAMLPAGQRPRSELLEQLAVVRALAANKNGNPEAFAQSVGRIGRVIYDSCGNVHLTRILREEAAGSLWGHLWRERTIDFLNQKRRSAALAEWSRLVDAILAGEGSRAAAIMRKAIFDSRDAAIETLQQLRGESVNPSRFVRD